MPRDRSHQQENTLEASLKEIDAQGYERPAAVDPTAESAAARFAALRAKNGLVNPAQVQELQEQIRSLQSELATQKIPPQNALMIGDDGNRVLGRFKLTRTALIIPEDISQDEMELMGDLLRQMSGAMQFWIGDYANMFHDGWGAMYDRLADYFQMDRRTLENWAWVCRKIEKSRRRENLSFSHHAEVAGLGSALVGREDELLEYALVHGLNRQDFRQYIKSLLMPKNNSKQDITALFDKDRVPTVAELKKSFLKARSGDEQARQNAKQQIETYTRWLRDIAEALGLE